VATAPVDTNLSPLDFWRQEPAEREKAFTYLRNHDPVSWHEAPEALAPGMDNALGYWSVTKHEDIVKLSRDPKMFSSAEGVFVDDFPQLETILSFIVMDAPGHTQMRGIVQKAFSPNNMRKMEGWIRENALELIKEVAPRGEADMAEEYCKQLPGKIFASFIGVTDPDTVYEMMEASEQLGSWSDPKYTSDGTPPMQVFAGAHAILHGIAMREAAKRREDPQDDLMTWVLQSEFEGRSMTDEELGAFFALLSGAANDTSRHALGHALFDLQEHPDQKAWLLEDFEGRIDGAIDELLRWSPPLMHFRRTAQQDVELRGKEIKQGDKVVLWYISGNRDEDVFDDPFEFRLDRDPNRHLSFGGGGPHFCLGSALGRAVLKAGLREVYTHMPDLEVAQPKIQLSNFMYGVKELPGRWTPTQP
jgi:cytochrome P450